MMTSSDIIAIVAIAISAIVSVISAIITYKNNRANNEAKRSEITLEKRLDAFSAIVSEIGKITTWAGSFTHPDIKTAQDARELLNKYSDINFLALYLEKRIFFPKYISQELNEFIDLIFQYGKEIIDPLTNSDENFDKDKAISWHKIIRDKEDKIVNLIQEFLGLR